MLLDTRYPGTPRRDGGGELLPPQPASSPSLPSRPVVLPPPPPLLPPPSCLIPLSRRTRFLLSSSLPCSPLPCSDAIPSPSPSSSHFCRELGDTYRETYTTHIAGRGACSRTEAFQHHMERLQVPSPTNPPMPLFFSFTSRVPLARGSRSNPGRGRAGSRGTKQTGTDGAESLRRSCRGGAPKHLRRRKRSCSNGAAHRGYSSTIARVRPA